MPYVANVVGATLIMHSCRNLMNRERTITAEIRETLTISVANTITVAIEDVGPGVDLILVHNSSTLDLRGGLLIQSFRIVCLQ